MERLLKEYILRKEKKYTEYDNSYVNFIFRNMECGDEHVILDCHGLIRDELLYFLEFLDAIEFNTPITFITGKGNHSKKPKMDYYCSKLWRSPLKQTIVSYYTKNRKGFCIKEYPCYVFVKPYSRSVSNR